MLQTKEIEGFGYFYFIGLCFAKICKIRIGGEEWFSSLFGVFVISDFSSKSKNLEF